MGWILGKITGNPMVIAYIAAAAFAAGLATGAIPVWKIQGYRIDIAKARFDKFVASTKSEGIIAAAAAVSKDKENELIKEKYDEQQKAMADELGVLSGQLYNSRAGARSSYLPKASPSSKHPDTACLYRAKLNAAMGHLDEAGQAIIDQGDSARIGLDIAKSWAQNRQ